MALASEGWVLIFVKLLRKKAHRLLLAVFISAALFIFFLVLSTQLKFLVHAYGFSQAMHYSLLVLPVNLYTLFPILWLLAIWLFFYRLHLQGIMMHLFACGMTSGRMLQGLILPWVMWWLLALTLGEVLGPHWQKHAKQARMQAMTEHQVIEQDQGFWMREDDGFVQAQRGDRNDRLFEIRRYFFSKGVLVAVESTSEAFYRHPYWYWKPGMRFELAPTVQQYAMPEQRWSIPLTPELLRISRTSSQHRDLYQAGRGVWFDRLGLFSSEEAWMFWMRWFAPWQTLLLAIWVSQAMLWPCLMRLHHQRLWRPVLFVLGFYLGSMLWSRFVQMYASGLGFWAGLLPCILLVGFILRMRSGRMIEETSKGF